MAVASIADSASIQAQRQARLNWWREAKLGMFLHWGLYSLPAGEWRGGYYHGIGEWVMYTARFPIADRSTVPESRALADGEQVLARGGGRLASAVERIGQKVLATPACARSVHAIAPGAETESATPWATEDCALAGLVAAEGIEPPTRGL